MTIITCFNMKHFEQMNHFEQNHFEQENNTQESNFCHRKFEICIYLILVLEPYLVMIRGCS